MPPGGAFRALLLLLCGASAAAPPGGLNVTCHNQQVTVSWEDRGPGTSYTVRVEGSAGEQESETTGNRYDLTRFVWASEDRSLGFHSVTVTAHDGGNQSETMESETFTFNHLKPAHIKCKLDFPPVDLNEANSEFTLSFQNPLLFYTELKQVPGSSSPTFTFNGSNFSGECHADDKKCKLTLPGGLPAGERCVQSLDGKVAYGSRSISFRKTGPVCAPVSTDWGVLVLSLMLLLFFIVTSVVIVLICRVKAWTMKNNPAKTPISLVLDAHEGDMRYALVSREDLSPVTVTENQISRTLPVCSEEDLRLDGGVSEDDGGVSEDDSEETEAESIDLPHYDRRQMLEVDMGDGDLAIGYSHRRVVTAPGDHERAGALGGHRNANGHFDLIFMEMA
ncbi:interferon gamma receptor 1 [Gasterosteus aculeatus]